MINIIKTAIITIAISFISGLLLDYYKNLAPRILCNLGKGIPMEMNGKKIFAYIITIINVSNKTIHELTLNIQSSQSNLKSTDAKITKGLKFDSSIKDNILDFYIPFLSKSDKFSATLYVENQYAVHDKPVIVIRSPENFKRIDSAGQNGILSLLFNIPKDIKQVILKIMKKSKVIAPNKKDNFTTVMNKPSDAEKTINKENRKALHENKQSNKNKKAMIIIASIILVMIIGVLGKSYFKRTYTNAQTPIGNTIVPQQSNDVKGSAGRTSENKSTNASTRGSAENTDANTSTGGSTENKSTNASTGGSTENKNTNALTGGSTENKSTNTSTGESTENKSTNASTGGSTENKSTNASTGGSIENTSTKSSTEKSTGNTDVKSSSGESTGNTDVKSSTGGSTGNTGN
ncbi:membrane protein [Clostridium arbusti]|uniref:membrane protein n=1 Tax=Clostridium arbusti TaxID=1137848 RepID=UPI00028876F6|nr:membrane protein [Clostridium arbusti]